MTAVALPEDVQVDHTQIEKSLAHLWRDRTEEGKAAPTRAALWNVVAHTVTEEQHAQANDALGRASADVPQRSILVRADPSQAPSLKAYVSANLHPQSGEHKIYSEEISIVATGDRIHLVPPLVESLLIPDMQVGVWWLGDLPNDREEYVQSLLGPADRLIVDSVHFDSPADLDLVARVTQQTVTAPADLNWLRLEEWRVATASVFDPYEVRARMHSIRKVRIVTGTADDEYFGHRIEALLYAGWLSSRLDHYVDSQGKVEGSQGAIEYVFETRRQTADIGAISFVELRFNDGSSAAISRDRDRGILTANVDGRETLPASITRARLCDLPNLIARQLKHPESDYVFVKTLPIATRLARRVNR